eukprot:scaffold65195_cov37-Attheya_sp.AAC.2
MSRCERCFHGEYFHCHPDRGANATQQTRHTNGLIMNTQRKIGCLSFVRQTTVPARRSRLRRPQYVLGDTRFAINFRSNSYLPQERVPTEVPLAGSPTPLIFGNTFFFRDVPTEKKHQPSAALASRTQQDGVVAKNEDAAVSPCGSDSMSCHISVYASICHKVAGIFSWFRAAKI